MAFKRTAIPFFELANSAYESSVITFYAVDPDTFERESTLITLYAGKTGSTTLSNPLTLDSDGKFSVPVYASERFIAVVSDVDGQQHTTGIWEPALSDADVTAAAASATAAASSATDAQAAENNAEAAQAAAVISAAAAAQSAIDAAAVLLSSLLKANNLSDLTNAVTARANLGLTALAIATTTAADKLLYTTGANAYAETAITSFGRSLIDDANAAAGLATLTALGQGSWEIPIPASAMWPANTNGAEYGKVVEVAATQPTIFALAFDPTTKEYAQFALRWPKSLGTATFTFKPVWAHPATTTNFGVVFSCAALALSDDDALGTAFGTSQTSTDTGGTTNDLYMGPTSSAITPSNTPATNDFYYFQIAREIADASDNMAVDAYLIGIVLTVTVGAANDA